MAKDVSRLIMVPGASHSRQPPPESCQEASVKGSDRPGEGASTAHVAESCSQPSLCPSTVLRLWFSAKGR